MKLNQQELLKRVYLNVRIRLNPLKRIFSKTKIPRKEIPTITQNLPIAYLERFIKLITDNIEGESNIEYNLVWIQNILYFYSGFLTNASMNSLSLLRSLIKSLGNRYQTLNKM